MTAGAGRPALDAGKCALGDKAAPRWAAVQQVTVLVWLYQKMRITARTSYRPQWAGKDLRFLAVALKLNDLACLELWVAHVYLTIIYSVGGNYWAVLSLTILLYASSISLNSSASPPASGWSFFARAR